MGFNFYYSPNVLPLSKRSYAKQLRVREVQSINRYDMDKRRFLVVLCHGLLSIDETLEVLRSCIWEPPWTIAIVP